VTEQDRKSLPEFPHEGPPYQGYGPAPYQPPAPVPPPVPVGYGMPYQQAVPSDQPPPPADQPPAERPAPRSPRPASSATGDGEIVQKWGYVMACSTVVMPILGVVGLVLGIITATKPNRRNHGAAIIGISVVLGVVTAVLWATVYND
jgi:hypothetical protein